MPTALLDSMTIFLGILFEATPFILLGVVVSTILHLYVSESFLLRIIPKNPFLGVLLGLFIGFLFPVCECGNIPVARRLIKKKVPAYIALTFLLAAPVINPVVLFATSVAFKDQPEMVYLRLGISAFIALSIGLLMSLRGSEEELLSTSMHSHEHHNHSTCAISQKKSHSFRTFASHAAEEFIEMMGILILGAFLASIVQLGIPRNILMSIASSQVMEILAMMLFAVIISICSTVDAFFILSYTVEFSTPAILAFLIFGPMIDIKALLMLRSTFNTKTIFWITLLAGSMTLLSTLFLNTYVY